MNSGTSTTSTTTHKQFFKLKEFETWNKVSQETFLIELTLVHSLAIFGKHSELENCLKIIYLKM